MVGETEPCSVILWVDGSVDSLEAQQLLTEAEVRFESHIPNIDSPLAPAEVPSLQTPLHRYPIGLIRALAQGPSDFLHELIKQDNRNYLALVAAEEEFGKPYGETLPEWSPRQKSLLN